MDKPHELSAIQADDLARHLGGEYTYTHENILWSASEDAERDKEKSCYLVRLDQQVRWIAGYFSTALEAASGDKTTSLSAHKSQNWIGEGLSHLYM